MSVEHCRRLLPLPNPTPHTHPHATHPLAARLDAVVPRCADINVAVVMLFHMEAFSRERLAEQVSPLAVSRAQEAATIHGQHRQQSGLLLLRLAEKCLPVARTALPTVCTGKAVLAEHKVGLAGVLPPNHPPTRPHCTPIRTPTHRRGHTHPPLAKHRSSPLPATQWPSLMALHDRVMALPRIAAYLASPLHPAKVISG